MSRKPKTKLSDSYPDVYCVFCGDKLPRESQRWWQVKVCNKEECQKKNLEQIRQRSRNYSKKLKETYTKVYMKPKLNGRKCVECGKKLKGNYRYRCPDCLHRVDNSFLDTWDTFQIKYRITGGRLSGS